MTIQAFVNVLNELQSSFFESNGGDDAYMLVENTASVREKLSAVGITEQEIKNAGDNDSFCLLALAFGKHAGQLEYDGEFRMSNDITLEQLYEMQKVLDARIIKEKGLEGQDLLPNTILALQVEIAELAQEWRGFKHWSNDRKARTEIEILCPACDGTGADNWKASEDLLRAGHEALDFEPCLDCNATGKIGFRNPLLEEYVDCLHFFLSIAGQLDMEPHKVYVIDDELEGETTTIFTELLVMVARLQPNEEMDKEKTGFLFRAVFGVFVSLGEQRLGFDFDQITAAYMEKNKVNHKRQENGY